MVQPMCLTLVRILLLVGMCSASALIVHFVAVSTDWIPTNELIGFEVRGGLPPVTLRAFLSCVRGIVAPRPHWPTVFTISLLYSFKYDTCPIHKI